MRRLVMALSALSAVAVMAWSTLSDMRFRVGTLVVLAGIAVKMLVEHRRKAVEGRE